MGGASNRWLSVRENSSQKHRQAQRTTTKNKQAPVDNDPFIDAGMDPHSVEAVEWALWCTLGCQCEACRFELELPFWNDPPWNGDVGAWSKEMAPKAQSLGWSMAADGFNLICPSCKPA